MREVLLPLVLVAVTAAGVLLACNSPLHNSRECWQLESVQKRMTGMIKVLEITPRQGERWGLKELVLVRALFPAPRSTLLLILYSVVELQEVIITLFHHSIGLAWH